MQTITYTKRLKIVALNLIGISMIYGISFCYGRHVAAVMANEPMVRYSTEIQDAAKAVDLNPALIAAVIHAESNFKATARSPVGAQGLMQIMPATQKMLGCRNGFDPKQNIMAGSHYLRDLIDRFGGNLVNAIAAYNAGPGAVEKHDGVPPYKETRAYVQTVLGHYSRYQKAFNSDPFMS
ncbi:MAG: lytic transglycosylase domain-containing protein [bacterium]